MKSIVINNLNLPVYANHLEPLELSTDMYYQQPVAALSYNGRLLAVPRDVSNLLIYYNKDLFDSYNIPYPDNDWTLDDLLNIEVQKRKSRSRIATENLLIERIKTIDDPMLDCVVEQLNVILKYFGA